MPRYFITLSYRGTEYHGWQYQPNAFSVQEAIEAVLSRLFRQTIPILGSGRTDAGVHARKQVIHVDLPDLLTKAEREKLQLRLNGLLPGDIAVFSINPVAEKAHARFDAYKRTYEYFISYEKNPFGRDLTWRLFASKLDVARMQEAADRLKAHTNFKAFCRGKTDVKTYDCTIEEAIFVESSREELCFRISANRFLRNMVRAIVGTLVEVGKGKRTVDDFDRIILSQDRTQASQSAPAHGLYLTDVRYPDSIYLPE